jgi:6-phosphogluconolactonase
LIASPAPGLLVYPDRDALSRAAAEQFVEISNEAIALHGGFAVALSGGSTPRQMYDELASNDFSGRVNWKRVSIFWGDERAVPPDDAESNYRMANEALLSRVPVPRGNIYRIPAEKPPQVAAMEYEQTLRSLWGNTLKGFDLVLLGLGTNGHTASLFPHTSALQEKSHWCEAVWVPELVADRITLTALVLNQSANVIFLVAGRDKSAILHEVLRGPNDPERLPAQLIQPEKGRLEWLVDQEAASEL